MDTLQLTVTLKEIAIELTVEGGAVKNYVLRELTGKQRDIFLDDVGGRVRFIGGKARGLNSHKDLQANLLTMCLHNDEQKLVTIKELQEFPASTLTTLFKAAQALSGLEDDKEEESADLGND